MKKYQHVFAILAVILLVCALTLLIIGILNGGFADLLQKARMICYECIGIG